MEAAGFSISVCMRWVSVVVVLDLLLDPLDMPPSQSFDLAPQFEIAGDILVVEQAETVDNRRLGADHVGHLVRGQGLVGLVGHGQDDGIGSGQRAGQVLGHPQFAQVFLVAEKPRPTLAGRRVGILLFKLPPVLDVRVVHHHLRAHLSQFAHDHLGAAVAGIAHILAVRGAEHGDS